MRAFIVGYLFASCVFRTDLTAAVKTLEEQKLDLEEQANYLQWTCIFKVLRAF